MICRFRVLRALIYPYWNVNKDTTPNPENFILALIYPYWNVNDRKRENV